MISFRSRDRPVSSINSARLTFTNRERAICGSNAAARVASVSMKSPGAADNAKTGVSEFTTPQRENDTASRHNSAKLDWRDTAFIRGLRTMKRARQSPLRPSMIIAIYG